MGFSSSGYLFTEFTCIEVIPEFIDVADDVLLFFANGEKEYQGTLVATASFDAPFTLSGTGVVVSFSSNQHLEGTGARIHFNSYDTCGNGLIDLDSPEDCDHGNSVKLKGCSTCCKKLAGVICSEICGRSTYCWMACGDGIVQDDMGEECDVGEEHSVACVDCLLTEDEATGSEGTYAECNPDDVPILDTGEGSLMASYATDAYCLWGVLPAVDECLVFALLEFDIANDVFYVYAYPTWDELCHPYDGGILCGANRYDGGDFLTLDTQVILIMEGNADNNVGVGFHWEYSNMGDCGNGIIDGLEMCDDGNGDNGDGCTSCCLIEEGFTCTPASNIFTGAANANSTFGPSVCGVSCGDGLVEYDATTNVFEACDDMNSEANDGCFECEVELGYVCEGNPSVCWVFGCGNGVLDESEECDDGNSEPFDGCFNCFLEDMYYCRGEPSECDCLVGSSLDADGRCVEVDTVVLEVGNYGHKPCSCFAGNASECCLLEALEFVSNFPQYTQVHICLHAAEVHYPTRVSTNDTHTHAHIARANIILEPCDPGSTPVIDFEHRDGFGRIQHSSFVARGIHVVFGHSNHGVFNLYNSTAVIENVIVDRCASDVGASAISLFDDSEVFCSGISVLYNSAQTAPIAISSGRVTLHDSEMEHNVGGTSGAIFGRHEGGSTDVQGYLELKTVRFYRNVGVVYGVGGLSFFNINATDCVFDSNMAITLGGSHVFEISLIGSALMKGCIFSNNGDSSQSESGTLAARTLCFHSQIVVGLQDCQFLNNVVNGNPRETLGLGGAIDIFDGSLVKGARLTFSGNTATEGGAMRIADSDVEIRDSVISNNTAVRGGAFFLAEGASRVSVVSSIISGNIAEEGNVVFANWNTAIASFVEVDSDAHALNPDDVVGVVETCGDNGSLCGARAICIDGDFGAECVCPSGMAGDPLALCYDPTGMELELLGSTIEQTLTKPATSTVCIVLASTGGLGKTNTSVQWEVDSANTQPSWLQMRQKGGSVEVGYCGSEEEDNFAMEAIASPQPLSFTLPPPSHPAQTARREAAAATGATAKATGTATTTGCESYVDTPDTDLLLAELTTQGLTQGQYAATINMRSNSDTVSSFSFTIKLSVLTVAHGLSSAASGAEGLYELCEVIYATAREPVEFVIDANDVDNVPLHHGGDDLSVSVLAVSSSTECPGGTSDFPDTLPDGVRVMSLSDERNGKYRVRISYDRSGSYHVHFQLNGETLSNSPLIVSASCPSGESADADGSCHSEDFVVQAVIIAALVGIGGGTCFATMRLYLRRRKRIFHVSDFGYQVVLVVLGTLMDVGGITSHWIAVHAVDSRADIAKYTPAYAVFASLATVFVCMLDGFRISCLMLPRKMVLLAVYIPEISYGDDDGDDRAVDDDDGDRADDGDDHDVDDGDDRVVDDDASSHREIFSHTNQLSHMSRTTDDRGSTSVLSLGSQRTLRFLGICVSWRTRRLPNEVESVVESQLSEFEHARALLRMKALYMVIGLFLAVVVDLPIVGLSSNITFMSSQRSDAVVTDMCLSSITAGVRLQSIRILRDTLGEISYLSRKMRKIKHQRNVQSALKKFADGLEGPLRSPSQGGHPPTFEGTGL